MATGRGNVALVVLALPIRVQDINNGCALQRSAKGLSSTSRCSKIIRFPGDRQRRGEKSRKPSSVPRWQWAQAASTRQMNSYRRSSMLKRLVEHLSRWGFVVIKSARRSGGVAALPGVCGAYESGQAGAGVPSLTQPSTAVFGEFLDLYN